MKRFAIFFLMFLALVVLACGEIPTEPPLGASTTVPPTAVPPTAVPPTAVPATPTPPWPAEAQPLVDLAIADLISRTQATDVVVVKVEAVEWPDGCLGCPKQHEMCTEAIVPGYLVVLQAGGQNYEYRTDAKNLVRYCPTSVGSADWGTTQPLVEKAIADLAGRLQVDPSTILVLSVESVMWRDSSIGCPKPGQAYLTVIVPGYRIVLAAGGKKYNYHAGEKGDAFLCEKPTQ